MASGGWFLALGFFFLVLIAVGIFVAAGLYALAAYVLYRIGSKFGVGRYFDYLIPFYNLYLLCRCGEVSVWVLIFLLLFAAVALWLWMTAANVLLVFGAAVVFLAFSAFLWGRIAEKLGKPFWIWGPLVALFLFPALFLAFGSDWPQEEEASPSFKNREDFEEKLGLRGLLGPYQGQTLVIPEEGLVIGRDPREANLVLPFPEISRSHAKVLPSLEGAGSVSILDLHSTNGVFIKRGSDPLSGWNRIESEETLAAGDRFRLAEGPYEFEVVVLTDTPLDAKEVE